MNGTVVLFKAALDENDKYQKTLEHAGCRVFTIPVLDFEFINLQSLLNKLKCPLDYDGIIFTSPRSMEGVRRAVGHNCQMLEKWVDHRHYVVGETTYGLVQEFGFTATGKESGNANNLADIIIQGEHTKPLLYPTGSLTKDNFQVQLRAGGVEVDTLVVYQTIPHPHLLLSLKDLIGQDLSSCPAFFVYFSPSGVQFTLPFLHELGLITNHIKLVAIGPSTEKALVDSSLTVFGTAEKPTAEALLNVLKQP